MPKSKKNKTKHNKKINNPVLFADFTELKAEKESSNDEIDKSTSGTECTESSGTENSDEWETVKGKGTIKKEKERKKELKYDNDEYRNIKKIYNFIGHERDEKSIRLVYDRYKLYERCGWNKEFIRKSLKSASEGNYEYEDLKLGYTYDNRQKTLPQNDTYQEFYLLSGAAGELVDPERPGTPRIVLGESSNTVYFCNHYKKFINIKTGQEFSTKKGSKA